MQILEHRYQDYIDKANKSINFFLSCRQWSGLNKTNVSNWLSNFPSDLKSRYFATRLLSQMLYYSEDDLLIMLREGVIHRVLEKEILTRKHVPSNFSFLQQQLQYDLRQEIEQTTFIPLLDKDKPYESGNQITRILTQRMNIPTSNVMFSYNIPVLRASHTRRLIIVDDCIGSGDQLKTFWRSAEIEGGMLLRDWCNQFSIEATYVVLIGYEANIEKVSGELSDLNICCVESLTDEHRVFSDISIFWSSVEEKNEAFEFFSQISYDFGVPILGYGNMDFAVAMHLNIPDWSLPLFWRGVPNWEILLERKNSYD